MTELEYIKEQEANDQIAFDNGLLLKSEWQRRKDYYLTRTLIIESRTERSKHHFELTDCQELEQSVDDDLSEVDVWKKEIEPIDNNFSEADFWDGDESFKSLE